MGRMILLKSHIERKNVVERIKCPDCGKPNREYRQCAMREKALICIDCCRKCEHYNHKDVISPRCLYYIEKRRKETQYGLSNNRSDMYYVNNIVANQ